MVVEWVSFQILTNTTMAFLGNSRKFKKFKVKVYKVVKLEICVYRGKTMYQHISHLKWMQKNILLPTSNDSVLSYWQKGLISMVRSLKFIQFGLVYNRFKLFMSQWNFKNRIFMTTSCFITIATRQMNSQCQQDSMGTKLVCCVTIKTKHLM